MKERARRVPQPSQDQGRHLHVVPPVSDVSPNLQKETLSDSLSPLSINAAGMAGLLLIQRAESGGMIPVEGSVVPFSPNTQVLAAAEQLRDERGPAFRMERDKMPANKRDEYIRNSRRAAMEELRDVLADEPLVEAIQEVAGKLKQRKSDDQNMDRWRAQIIMLDYLSSFNGDVASFLDGQIQRTS